MEKRFLGTSAKRERLLEFAQLLQPGEVCLSEGCDVYAVLASDFCSSCGGLACSDCGWTGEEAKRKEAAQYGQGHYSVQSASEDAGGVRGDYQRGADYAQR